MPQGQSRGSKRKSAGSVRKKNAASLQAARTRPTSKPGAVDARGNAGAASSTLPPITRAPIAQRSPLRARIDRALPPFSARRYVAIWFLGMIPIILAFLILLSLDPRYNGRPAPAATPTPRSQGTSATTSAARPSSTTQPAGSSGAIRSGVSAPGPSASPPGTVSLAAAKYMVIDTAKGRIVARLFTDPATGAPRTVANFEQKANSGYFDGLTFHRVEDWVAQGGRPQDAGGSSMPYEANTLPFKSGALAVAHGPNADTNSDSDFLIIKKDADFLDGQYTNFGQVTEGMDVVDKIAVGDKMTRVTVETRQ